jgi:MATE family multidrug resistance protein
LAPPQAPKLKPELETIARLAFPIVLAQLGITLLGLVDVAVLGHVSATDLAGASIGRSIGFVAIGLSLGAATALEPLASQAIGAGEPDVAWRSYLATSLACALVWLPCCAIALASTYALVPLGIAPELVPPCRRFLVAQTPGLLCFVLFLVAKTFLQAHKRTWATLLATVAANLVNVVACNILVRGELPFGRFGRLSFGHAIAPHGALGAGVASSLASIVLFGFVLVAVVRMRPTHAAGAGERAPLPVLRVLRLGVPLGLQILAEMGVFSLVAVLSGRLGEVAVGAHHIAMGLASFTFMGVLGVSGATAIRVGHAIGEGRSPRHAGFLGIGMGAAFMAVSGAAFLIAPRPLVSLFTDDPNVTTLAVRLLGVAAAFQLFDGVQCVSAGALRGAGDVTFAFVASATAHWLVGFPLAMLLGFGLHLGAVGFWWGLLAGLAVMALLSLWRFARISGGPLARV